MGCQIFAALAITLVALWPGAGFWNNQDAFQSVLGLAPRITAASLLAYFFSEFTNSVVLSKMKYRHAGMGGARQGWRFIASTIAGEFVDSIVFMVVAFVGVLATRDIVMTIGTVWIAKTLYEVIVLPFTMRFTNYVKKVEGVDHVDYPEHTSYNPFAVR